MKKKTGRNLIAREAHFRKAGPTEKVGRDRAREIRRQDHLEEAEALRESREPDDNAAEPEN